MKFRSDTRGASIAITHALTLGITSILITGLLISAGGLLDSQQRRVTERGLADVNEQVTNQIVYLDSMEWSAATSDISTRVAYPSRIAGSSYSIELLTRSSGQVVLYTNMSSRGVAVPTELEVDAPVCERNINGGPVRVVYDRDGKGGTGCLTIRGASR